MAPRPTAPGVSDGSFRHRATALVAVYAVLAQILLGTLAAAFGPAVAAGNGSTLAQLTVLCTPDGLVRIGYPDGSGAPDAPNDRVAPKCPFCFAGGHAPALAPSGAWVVDPPLAVARADWRSTDRPRAATHPFIESRPRAPPPIG